MRTPDLFAHLRLLSSDSFSSDLLSSLSLLSASSLLCFPSVHIVESLTSKLPSIISVSCCAAKHALGGCISDGSSRLGPYPACDDVGQRSAQASVPWWLRCIIRYGSTFYHSFRTFASLTFSPKPDSPATSTFSGFMEHRKLRRQPTLSQAILNSQVL